MVVLPGEMSRGESRRRANTSIVIELTRSEVKSKFAESIDVGAQNLALKGEVGALPFAMNLDEARRLELLDVMRQGCRADRMQFEKPAAGERRLARAPICFRIW